MSAIVSWTRKVGLIISKAADLSAKSLAFSASIWEGFISMGMLNQHCMKMCLCLVCELPQDMLLYERTIYHRILHAHIELAGCKE